MESLSFSDSKDFNGLQVEDLVANFFRRSFKGHLQREGYLGLRGLIIRRKGGALRLCMPIDGDRTDILEGTVKVPYGPILKELEKEHRSMLLPKFSPQEGRFRPSWPPFSPSYPYLSTFDQSQTDSAPYPVAASPWS